MSPLLEFALNAGMLSVALAVLLCSWRLLKARTSPTVSWPWTRCT
jgi:hypothetical protein